MGRARFADALEDGAVVHAAILPLLPETSHYNNLAASFPCGRPNFRFPALKYGCEKGLAAGLPPSRIYYEKTYYVWVAASSEDSSAASCGAELPVFVRGLLNLKLLAVAASQVTIIGNSNINDRSLLGMHDSEVKAIMQQPTVSHQIVLQLRGCWQDTAAAFKNPGGSGPAQGARTAGQRSRLLFIASEPTRGAIRVAHGHDTGRSRNCQSKEARKNIFQKI